MNLSVCELSCIYTYQHVTYAAVVQQTYFISYPFRLFSNVLYRASAYTLRSMSVNMNSQLNMYMKGYFCVCDAAYW